ncbi:glycogen debranching protein GlgX [Aestuariibacter salexigens]|uniref:glycogen debranching protein GlgX n=1 Tax=Aestuariibacter salexigens TaxID=226010 RepID=UPI0004091CD2|nr:glycogen debranching protein GlgX [Aestuariibacter salexigens]
MAASSWRIDDGRPFPLGTLLSEKGCNFAVHCPDATQVYLCLFHPDTEEQTAKIPLPLKTGSIWHGFVYDIQPGQLYGFRSDGKYKPRAGMLFDVDKLLIDPYARELNRPAVWNARQYEGDSQFMVPKCIVHAGTALATSTLNHKPHVKPEHTVLYEAHVKGLTMLHPDVPDEHKGKFLGACHPSVIAHLKRLGVSSVQLLPVMAFMPEPYISEKGLTNYWGYNPLNFFAPEPRYVVKNGIEEFRHMVEQFHQQGIEVILDVVFNHTAESGLPGPTLSFKGLDNRAMYLFEQDDFHQPRYEHYANYSGCGNTVHCAHPYVMTMIMDALRYWVSEMGVDGFRFDLAASLGRDSYDFFSQAGLFRAIRQDPVLADVKLIAEPWDIGPGGYRLGQFPANWHECNDKYRDSVRAFWRGDKGLMSEFATRIMGSRDVFHKGVRAIHTSVNNITYHDGFTLHDLVSYNQRHNLANLEDNRDGHGHNLSCNYGIEGPTSDAKILALRERQKRNLFTTLMLSQGIPHILGGDELSRTQQGNNNAYCQDNEISWIDWTMNQRSQDFLEFCCYVVKFRNGSKVLSNISLEDDPYHNFSNVEAVRWYRPDGEYQAAEDWHDHNNQSFAMEIVGREGREEGYEHWLVCFNASDNDVRFHLPVLSNNSGWCLILDTRYSSLREQPDICMKNVFLQAGKSVAVLCFSSASEELAAPVAKH